MTSLFHHDPLQLATIEERWLQGFHVRDYGLASEQALRAGYLQRFRLRSGPFYDLETLAVCSLAAPKSQASPRIHTAS